MSQARRPKATQSSRCRRTRRTLAIKAGNCSSESTYQQKTNGPPAIVAGGRFRLQADRLQQRLSGRSKSALVRSSSAQAGSSHGERGGLQTCASRHAGERTAGSDAERSKSALVRSRWALGHSKSVLEHKPALLRSRSALVHNSWLLRRSSRDRRGRGLGQITRTPEHSRRWPAAGGLQPRLELDASWLKLLNKTNSGEGRPLGWPGPRRTAGDCRYSIRLALASNREGYSK